MLTEKSKKKIKEKTVAKTANSIIRSIFPYLLILGGVFLNIWFHMFRFMSENISWWLAGIMGVVITAMINTLTLVYVEKRKRFALIILSFVAIYDVLSTSAGQSIFLHAEKNEAAIEQTQKNEEIIKKQIAGLDADIEELDADYKAKSELIRKSVIDLSTAYDYKNTLAKLEKEKADLWNKKDAKEKERNILLEKLTMKENDLSQVLIRNIYQYYGELFARPNWEGWSQFVMHLILSVIISGAAPLGIYLKSPAEKKRQEDQQEKTAEPEKKDDADLQDFQIEKAPVKPVISAKEITIIFRVAFNYMKNRGEHKFPEREIIIHDTKRIIPTFNDLNYDRIIKMAVKKGLLRVKSDGLYPDTDIEDGEVFIRRFLK